MWSVSVYKETFHIFVLSCISKALLHRPFVVVKGRLINTVLWHLECISRTIRELFLSHYFLGDMHKYFYCNFFSTFVFFFLAVSFSSFIYALPLQSVVYKSFFFSLFVMYLSWLNYRCRFSSWYWWIFR